VLSVMKTILVTGVSIILGCATIATPASAVAPLAHDPLTVPLPAAPDPPRAVESTEERLAAALSKLRDVSVGETEN